ncbi:MAG: class II fructose-1,6-bisphosphate aldolase [Lachnospiraceae bacterium]|nr:class II fructose-1,6-bisphosphate aldolase [Lachnospiraceae bacterium]
MSLVTSKEMLETARKKGYAVGAFNVENMEMVMAVLAAAEETGSPVIMQTTPGTIKYAGLDYYFANVRAAAERTKIPVVMHLDHGNSFELACEAFRVGYTSIMIDGSKKPFEENIALTKSVTDVCHSGNIPVEGELGRVGGKEDDLDNTDGVNPYTDPGEAREFVRRTNVDTLAVGIGTSHGVYKGIPKVNVEVLSAIRNVVDIPLVMHGTSGVPDEQVKDCVSRGICKVNYATDLRIAFTQGLKAHIAEHPDDFDPKKYCAPAMEKVKAYVMQKMEVVGSVGKA